MHILAWGPYAHGPKAIAQRTHTLRHHSLFYLLFYAIAGRKSKDIQYNGGQKERDKGINNDLQNTTQKTLDRATLTPQSTNIRQTMIYKTLHRKH
jgi:hypothetical protein